MINNKLLEAVVALAVVTLAVLVGISHYNASENRKAYYACLHLSEKIAEEQKQPNGGVRIVSLPYCRL